MKALTFKGALAALATTTLLAACGGGGGGGGGYTGGTTGGSTGGYTGGSTGGTTGGSTGGSTGGYVPYTHSELATKFVDYAYGDAGIDASLVKTNTDQYDYIVVYDYGYNTYDAYYIGAWTPDQNVSTYINTWNDKMYYDLDYLGGNQYQDYYTGLTFEEGTPSSKDLSKLAAFKQYLQLKKASSNIQAQFGLSEDRSQTVAKLAVQLAGAPKASLTNADYDNFSKELLGSSITQFNSAMKKSIDGDSKDLNGLLDKAAAVNGVGPEQMGKIMTTLMTNN